VAAAGFTVATRAIPKIMAHLAAKPDNPNEVANSTTKIHAAVTPRKKTGFAILTENKWVESARTKMKKPLTKFKEFFSNREKSAIIEENTTKNAVAPIAT